MHANYDQAKKLIIQYLSSLFFTDVKLSNIEFELARFNL